MQIVFATHNPNKVREINEILASILEIIGLEDIGCTKEIPETQATIKGNALQKARYVKEYFQMENLIKSKMRIKSNLKFLKIINLIISPML